MASDYELLDRWGAGDPAAARELFERYFDGIYRFFRHKTSSEVDDLVQETFAACVEGRERFRRESSFRSYLFAVARNKLLHHYRGRRDVADLEEIAESKLMELDPSPSRAVAKKEEERLLLEALRRLPLDHQIVIELYSWENLSGPEVAVALGITEAAMRSRLYRAKQELRRQLEELAESPSLLQSTANDLDGWAKAVRSLR